MFLHNLSTSLTIVFMWFVLLRKTVTLTSHFPCPSVGQSEAAVVTRLEFELCRLLRVPPPSTDLHLLCSFTKPHRIRCTHPSVRALLEHNVHFDHTSAKIISISISALNSDTITHDQCISIFVFVF